MASIYRLNWLTRFCASMWLFWIVFYILGPGPKLLNSAGIPHFIFSLVTGVVIAIPALLLVEKMANSVRSSFVRLVLGLFINCAAGFIYLFYLAHFWQQYNPQATRSMNPDGTAIHVIYPTPKICTLGGDDTNPSAGAASTIMKDATVDQCRKFCETQLMQGINKYPEWKKDGYGFRCAFDNIFINFNNTAPRPAN